MVLDAATSLTTLTEVFNQFLSWITSMLGTISGEPLLLLGVAVFVAGAIIYLAYKALHGRG